MAHRLIGRYEIRDNQEYMLGIEDAFHHILAEKDGPGTFLTNKRYENH